MEIFETMDGLVVLVVKLDPGEIKITFELQRQVIDVLKSPTTNLPDLEGAVRSRASFGNVSVTVSGGAIRGDGERARVPVNVTVAYKDLGSRREDSKIFYELDYVVVVSTEDGEEISRAEDGLTLSFDADQKDGLVAQRLSIQEMLSVPPGTYQLLAYVRYSFYFPLPFSAWLRQPPRVSI